MNINKKMKSVINLKKISKRSFEIFLLLTLFTALLTATTTAQTEDIYELTINYKKTASGDALSLIKIQKTTGSLTDYTTTSANAYKLDVVSYDNLILKSTKSIAMILMIQCNIRTTFSAQRPELQ